MVKHEEEIEEEVVSEEEAKETEEQSSEETTETEEVVEEIDEVEQLKNQLEEEESKYLRLLADYDNFKRRATLDKEALQKYRAQSVATNLIPVLDNFALALAVESKTDEAKTMMDGMNMIYRSLLTALESEGVTAIDAQGQPFDPNYHQAIMTEHDEEQESGIVLEELQKGYQLKDRVLRPAMVKVNE